MVEIGIYFKQELNGNLKINNMATDKLPDFVNAFNQEKPLIKNPPLREFEDTHIIINPITEKCRTDRELTLFKENLVQASRFILKASAMLETSKHTPKSLKVDSGTQKLYDELTEVWEVLSKDIKQFIKIHDKCALDYVTNIQSAMVNDSQK